MTYREKSPCSILSQMGHREKRERERLCTEVWHLAPGTRGPGAWACWARHPNYTSVPQVSLFWWELLCGQKTRGGLYNKSDKSRFKSGK